MCGIAAQFSLKPKARLAPGVVDHMCDLMAARGPDGFGRWASDDGAAVLGHRRLSIIDLSDAGAQPLADITGRYQITFNGEIYNYRELRADLEAKGHQFRTATDTEVILTLYATEGEAAIQRLRGMFAFVIWDIERRTAFAARDPFGIKPLYVGERDGVVTLCSQLKPIIHSGAADRQLDPAGVAGFFLLGYVPEPITILKGVRALSAGETLTIDVAAGTMVRRRYFDFHQALLDVKPAASIDLKTTVEDTIRAHMVADVPVGVFLSSGIDSTVIASHASRLTAEPLRTVTLGFDVLRGTPNDETPLAEAFAASLGARHHTVWLTRGDFADDRDKVLDAMDQPTVDAVNTYFVSKVAKSLDLKVALSGLGGDEFFGGYPSFQMVPAVVRRLARFQKFGAAFRVLAQPFCRGPISPKYAGLIEYASTLGDAYLLRRALHMPWELDQILTPTAVEAGLKGLDLGNWMNRDCEGLSPRPAISALEASWYMRSQLLRDSDWAGMAHSLEIRTPFVDIAFAEALSPTLTHPGSAPTKRDLALTADPALPPAILDRPKTGFNVPVRDWLMEERTEKKFQGRGLRGWSHFVFEQYCKINGLGDEAAGMLRTPWTN